MGAHSLVKVRYTTDDGLNIAVRQQQGLQEAAGNTLADGSEVARPFGLRLRHLQASWFSSGGAGQAVGKFTRSIVIGDPSNPLWSHADDNISLPDYDSVPGAGQTTPNVMRQFTTTGRVGESLTFS